MPARLSGKGQSKACIRKACCNTVILVFCPGNQNLHVQAPGLFGGDKPSFVTIDLPTFILRPFPTDHQGVALPTHGFSAVMHTDSQLVRGSMMVPASQSAFVFGGIGSDGSLLGNAFRIKFGAESK